jgi:hypothetical protein
MKISCSIVADLRNKHSRINYTILHFQELFTPPLLVFFHVFSYLLFFPTCSQITKYERVTRYQFNKDKKVPLSIDRGTFSSSTYFDAGDTLASGDVTLS